MKQNLKNLKFKHIKEKISEEDEEDDNEVTSSDDEQINSQLDTTNNPDATKKGRKKEHSKNKKIKRKNGDPFSMKMSTLKMDPNTGTWVYKSYWLNCIEGITENNFLKLQNEETVGYYSLVGEKLEMTKEQNQQLSRANVEYQQGWSYISRVNNCCEFDFEREDRIFKVHKPNNVEYDLLIQKPFSTSKGGNVSDRQF